MKTCICLMGPTAAGKTSIAVRLVQKYSFEIISVDSAMVYRGMNVGTAKPSDEELLLAPHRLIDICDPAKPYSAGHFREDALREIDSIIQEKKVPLLVGGSMLYFHALQKGLSQLPIADDSIREEINNEAQNIGWPAMHKKLYSIDPNTAEALHPNDSQRIQRALEIYKITGKTMSALQSLPSTQSQPYRFINICIEPEDRSNLHKRIAERFHMMLEQGFIDEVRELKKRSDLHENLPAIRTVGYRQVWSYLAGEYDQETMKERSIAATRQLAKRQLTWLRQWGNIFRFSFEGSDLYDRVSQQVSKELQD